ncbi:hypothetical protein HBI14_159520 [Parastagonospora nodorum]|nr:hypothetical protein HBI78_101030 [Parastagonospora nodorum]KAH6409064.1 hypothetical protein HBI14_159520 [Parastagonospora nodorum]
MRHLRHEQHQQDHLKALQCNSTTWDGILQSTSISAPFPARLRKGPHRSSKTKMLGRTIARDILTQLG